ncbi:MAG: aldo/keto reductase [Desulfobacterales bacterium]
MELNPLGSTDLVVSPVGVGLAALGRPGYINIGHAEDLEENYDNAAMEARAHEVLDEAYQHGVRYFDAARSYGRAEEYLGNWLRARDIPLKTVTVGSKWGYTYTAGWQVDAAAHEVKEHSLAVLKKQFEESRFHLGAYLNLYQIHSATMESGVLKNRSVLGELARLKSEGVAIGLSVSGSRQKEMICQSAALLVDGVRLFDSVQATWNLLERSAGEALSAAKKRGIAVIVKEPLANGRLTVRNQEPLFADRLSALNREAKRLKTTLDGLAIAAVLAQPWVDVVLSGAARMDHLQSNLRAVDILWDQEAESSLDWIKESSEAYWEKRKGLRWN